MADVIPSFPLASLYHPGQYPVIDLSIVCRPIPEMPRDLCLTLPGGVDLCASGATIPPSLFDYTRNFLDQVSAALTPLDPFFKVIEALDSIYRCFTAVLDALGPPPDPSKLTAAVDDLKKRLFALAKLSPALTIPILCVQFLDTIILTLDGIAGELVSITRLSRQITEATLRADQAPGLYQMIKCAEGGYRTQLSNIQRAFASCSSIIRIVNTLMHVAQIDATIPEFDGMTLAHEPDLIGQQIQKLADDLRVIRATIPL